MVNIGITFAVGLVGGLLFSFLYIPLPWMLGPLAGITLLSSCTKITAHWPNGLRNAGLLVLGYLMGRPFTPAAGQQILHQLPLMLGMTAILMLFSLAIGQFTARRTGMSLSSCVLGTVPGGLSQMVLLGEEIPGVDAAIVTFMQTVRLIMVVSTIPFLLSRGFAGEAAPPLPQPPVADASLEFLLPYAVAVIVGALAATWLRLPTPYLLGPILATCVLVLSGLPAPALPSRVTVAAQLFVGIYMGVRIKLDNITQCRAVVPYTLFNVGGVLLLSLGLGYGLAKYTSASLVTGFLSTAPGGMTEMGLAALLYGADLTTVISYHLFRLLFILLIVPIFLKTWLGATRPDSGPA
ncbi:MAG TPA: AbrB family transcriptional regulator [Selenomonadales bacterium]|nr:AbrB family transcriptional regulator [Selenomonadales bacterium]